MSRSPIHTHTHTLAIWSKVGFSVLPKVTSTWAGNRTANPTLSGQPALPPEQQPPLNLHRPVFINPLLLTMYHTHSCFCLFIPSSLQLHAIQQHHSIHISNTERRAIHEEGEEGVHSTSTPDVTQYTRELINSKYWLISQFSDHKVWINFLP
ncbi:hypothetical protein AMELA_G00062110 [Ameiurus melas]|uniref:Uncharacterized protein n=1 Tax=Ameiurus melas TaxID=219545 RepID=A0A7J6B2D3_AMEME|nr:hypothetical protein AMELA_G00062110 [Ameiurus melas]